MGSPACGGGKLADCGELVTVPFLLPPPWLVWSLLQDAEGPCDLLLFVCVRVHVHVCACVHARVQACVRECA